MGYEINSTWTRLRQDDIKKLNEVIDDEYCRELEIGRKLNMMKKFTEEFEDEIKSLNWDNITKFMHDNNWEWYMGGRLSFDNCAIPTKEEMIDRLRTHFFKHGLYNIIELGTEHFSTFSGGFNFEMGYNGDNYWVHICFDIAHFSNQ